MTWFDKMKRWLEEKPLRADFLALFTLTILWAFYFWRVLTPNLADQVSYPAGDFSGQFLAFGSYQAQRILAGQIPLWNPFNYAGHPFIADTQAAVFYPPRLITILISSFTGGWQYATIQAEALAHYWLGSVWMYLFVRTITKSRMAGLVSALTLAYGGYLTGYPPLQLAVLEAGIWMPLSLLGAYKATETGKWRWNWLAVAALGMGLSLMAGHPQTSLHMSYVLLAYLIHRAVKARQSWISTLLAVIAVFGAGYGLAGVQLLPGFEYTRLTIRAGYGFDELANGFPFTDLAVFVLPNVVSLYSPLYSGIAALALAALAVWHKRDSARFWGVITLVALGLSFGGGTVIYRLAYLIAPGFSWFRGQERAAYEIAHSVAIMAGLGAAGLFQSAFEAPKLRRILGIGSIAAWAIAAETLIISRFVTPDTDTLLRGVFFLAVLVTLVWVLLGVFCERKTQHWYAPALIALVIFDLFSLTWQTNWEPVPAEDRVLFSKTLVEAALEDDGVFRVDGRLGLGGNYGTMVGLQDIRGVSPLRLVALEGYQTRLEEVRVFELLGVKYVFTDWEELPIPTEKIAVDQFEGAYVPWNLLEIEAPAPRAWMAYEAVIVASDNDALIWLAQPDFDVIKTALLLEDPGITLPEAAPERFSVTVTDYQPEAMTLEVETETDGILMVSEWDYPGWQAQVDGQDAAILRADAGLRALPLEAGTHTVTFVYRPVSVTIGAVVSLLALGTIGAGLTAGKRRNSGHPAEDAD